MIDLNVFIRCIMIVSEPYAIMPPLERFMDVPHEERRELFYRDVERGDIAVGRITSIRDFGLFMNLLCTAGGLERDVEDLEITVRSASSGTSVHVTLSRYTDVT